MTESTTPPPETKSTDAKKTARKKRTFKLHSFTPQEGRSAPKNGGLYKSIGPSGAAIKASNRWIVPKDDFDNVYTFFIREVGAPKEKSIFEFSAKRVKLKKPKTYTRGEKQITVESKIELVDKPE